MHLIITEKHNTAKRISEILAPKKPKSVRVSGVDTYQWDTTVVMGLSGHIVSVDFPKEYNNWQKVDSRELISADIITTPTQHKIVAALRKLGKESDHVTIATDFDREGELIGVEALRIVEKVNKGITSDRVHYSTITKKEILKAFDNTNHVDFNLAAAGQSRQVIDLIWGAALTRYISTTAGRLGNLFLSVGRVQTPTLALLVDRERERLAHVPRTYWEIIATLADSIEFEAKHKAGRIWDGDEANRIFNTLGDTAKVIDLKAAERVDHPPMPFNTTEFIRAASSIGFTASNAMRIAETLYMNGFISYPRTDNTVYPSSIDMRELINSLGKGVFKPYVENLLQQPELTPTRGKKETTDHPPVIPASFVERSKLKDDEWKIYELVVRRFFATFAPPAKWKTMQALFDISKEEFKSRGASLLEEGWRWYYPYHKPEDMILPDLEVGQVLSVVDKQLLEKETQPPGRYGQGRLIKLMEDLGLGTKSTRHEIISKLYSRAYVHGNPLQPTKTAMAVIETLETYAQTITKPEMTATLETEMDLISEGVKTEDDVVDESREMLRAVFDDLSKNSEKITEGLRTGMREDKIIGTCEKCQSDLIIRRSKKGGRFIGCTGYPDCDFSLPLPKSGQIVVTDKLCEKHNINHIKIINKGKRPWELGCSYCNYLEWQKSIKDSEDKKQ
ncbi:MAG: DNA topoisomerase I [ANME-2 cluster archaeon]|nr:DNA topoisomerase I [ANME-2 cluster archaeon]